MRDFRFRAYTKKEYQYMNGFRMFNVGSISFTSKKVRVNMKSIGMSGYSPASFKFSEVEIMEGVNKLDSNSKEVFEGDILSKDGFWDIRIEWYKNGLKVLDLDKVRYNNKILNLHASDFDFSDWEIIGNIHENPELLEKN